MTEDAENAVVESAQVEAARAPKRKFAKQLSEAPALDPMVKCRVTSRGADRISTGKHLDVLGDEKYAEGEEFETELSNALMLRDGDEAYQMKYFSTTGFRDWIEIIEPKVPRKQLVPDNFSYGAA
jgi:hypothetical protein